MDAKEEPFVAINPKSGPVTDYGLFIDVKDDWKEYFDSLPHTHRKVEIAVRHNGVTKEFTFANFFKQLGFE